jgi:phage gp46-like protein
MVDIPLQLASDGTSIDWPDVSVLAQPMDSSRDLASYVVMLLATDRVAPPAQYGLEPYQRRGSWHDSYVGEFGSLFWLATEENKWLSGPKLSQIKRYAEQALQPLQDAGMIQQPADVTASWLTNESVELQIGLVAADTTKRTITFVLPA